MKPEIRDMTPQERKYTYTQSAQIAGQTGCIGHLRVDMGGGKEFYTSWDDHTPRLNDAVFKTEINEVIHGLRKRGQMLSSRDRLTKYCYAHPEASFGDGKTWGVRVDTEKMPISCG